MREVICFSADTQLNGNTVQGYAAKFGVLSHDLGGFRTRLQPDCFSKAMQKLDCTLNLDHDDSRLLGRTTSGTLQVRQDETGLWFSAQLPNTTVGNDARELLDRGDISECSFAVLIAKSRFVEEEDLLIRELQEIDELLDVSLVVRPAFPKTEVSLHALEKWKKSRCKPRLLDAKLKQLMAKVI